MGEVYRANDTKLGRDVALKVLPEEMANDEARLARFEHEARTLARLNHPNIVTVHSVEEAEDIRFLTMELVEGETLVASIGPSGMALDELLRLMTPIARAVAAAHEGALVHRDLKPGNVMVVFPFDNLGAAEDAYFASGMADEISSRLARVESFRLISRTSATQYDRTGKTMPQIAADLGVDFVLEGTVRWSGGGGQGSRIRITPSLIDVSRDEQLWSDSYDEVLEEVFAVQSRVAEQVIRELNLTLGDSARQALTTRPTENLEAYRLYLKGIEVLLRGSQKAVISLPMIRLYPVFDTLRDHPRFRELEAEFGS